MKHIYLLLSLLLICTSIFAQTRINSNFAFSTNSAKKYSLYVPSGYNANVPNKMMLGMHPFNTSRWDARAWCDTLINFAETNNLLLVCPDGGTNGNVSDQIDTAFTSALLDSVRNWYNIDQKNTYIMGFSVGGRVTYTYGLSHPDVFGGLMPIGAAISGLNEVNTTLQGNSNCRGVYIVHGANDAQGSRYTPIRAALINSGAILNSILLSGVGHTVDFPNRNQILTTAFQWLDSVNNVQLVSDAGPAITSCAGVGVSLGTTDPGKGGQCPYTYEWSPAAGLSSATAANPIATPTQTTTYTLRVIDDRGDTATSQIVVTAAAAPTLSVVALDSVCLGDSVQLSSTSNGMVTWGSTSGLSCTNCATPMASPSSSTTYTVIASDVNGCESVPKTVFVKVNSLPSVFTSQDRDVCRGDSISINAFSNNNIRWSPAAGLNCTACPSPMAAPSATTTYSAIAINAKGCESAPDNLTITVLALPTLTTSTARDSICVGDSVRLTASSMSSGPINWQPVGSLSCGTCPNPFAGPRTATTYWATVTDMNSCRSLPDSIDIFMLPQPVVSAGADISVCFGDSIQLSASPSGNLKWGPAASLSCTNCESPKAAPRVKTVFTVITTDAKGCESEPDSINVAVNPVPTALFTHRPNGNITSFTDRSIGAVSWFWDFGDGSNDTTQSPFHVFPKQNFQVCLTVTNALGCTNTFCDSVMGLGVAIDPLLQANIQIYPNPTSGNVFLRNQDISLKAVEIQVLDMFGRRLFVEKRTALATGERLELQLESLPTGMYLVDIRAGGRRALHRIEVLR